MQEIAAGANLAMAIAALYATGQATRMKIEEGKLDYGSEITRLESQKRARERIAESEIARAKEIGIETLAERGAQAAYETRMATMKAEQTASSAEARLGASGVRAGGTALAAAQQNVDIAYAGAQRTAEAGAAQMRVGGLQLRAGLEEGQEQKTLLSMEYGYALTQQRRKLAELEANAPSMIAWAYLGGLAGVTSSFYQSTQTNLWDWTKKKTAITPTPTRSREATTYGAGPGY